MEEVKGKDTESDKTGVGNEPFRQGTPSGSLSVMYTEAADMATATKRLTAGGIYDFAEPHRSVHVDD